MLQHHSPRPRLVPPVLRDAAVPLVNPEVWQTGPFKDESGIIFFRRKCVRLGCLETFRASAANPNAAFTQHTKKVCKPTCGNAVRRGFLDGQLMAAVNVFIDYAEAVGCTNLLDVSLGVSKQYTAATTIQSQAPPLSEGLRILGHMDPAPMVADQARSTKVLFNGQMETFCVVSGGLFIAKPEPVFVAVDLNIVLGVGSFRVCHPVTTDAPWQRRPEFQRFDALVLKRFKSPQEVSTPSAITDLIAQRLKIEFLPMIGFLPFASRTNDLGGYATLEPAFPTDQEFLKFVNNDCSEVQNDVSFENVMNILRGFMHYTFLASGCKYVVCDLQGVVLNSVNNISIFVTSSKTKAVEDFYFGDGNCSFGFKRFPRVHKCSFICQKMGYLPLNKNIDF
ncbi:hypothetical protein BCR33DRAFT_741756 [Rhizoclosmatium globosum]|uniref:Alpha-type protein kinase domain-containing protein n=1 Tax=Rhizoclosmatium globosum TaxID=329046 RepID=A0A1Y2BU28_9FUNG|nr:hypothetical protein BCR33DRAFT_741756 [Rhizoclosmatium globosum]|eukprot:ORY38256.1 hypothetical protein BCR33DRAFT_741756 [Rhizoclosmatium globosum]